MDVSTLILAGAAALAVTLALLGRVRSRFVRGRLVFSAWLLLAFLGLELAVGQGLGDGPLVSALARLVFVLALVNLTVALLVNPWRDDRPSDRVPAIVQDVAVIGLFPVIATVLMREQLLATSAVGAVVVGFALQDTLGNFFAGLAIQIEKPFRVGHWIRVGGPRGPGPGSDLARHQAADQGRPVPHRAQQLHVEGPDPQLLRADGSDAHRRRRRHQLPDAAERGPGRHPAGRWPTRRW